MTDRRPSRRALLMMDDDDDDGGIWNHLILIHSFLVPDSLGSLAPCAMQQVYDIARGGGSNLTCSGWVS